MLSDVLALGLSMVAIYFASKAPTQKYTFGFLRLEIIAAFLNGLALMVISLWILYEGIVRIIHPQQVESGLMVFIASIGLIVNIILTLIFSQIFEERRQCQYSKRAVAFYGRFIKFCRCYCGCNFNTFYWMVYYRPSD